MDIIGLLKRSDYYEISGNRMTSYCTTLGGGSISYWDGKKASFDPAVPLCDLTAFVEVLHTENKLNLVQQMYHFWQPDKIVNKFHTHARAYIEEEKTVHNDTFVSRMDFHNEGPVDLIIRLSGAVSADSSIEFRDNVLITKNTVKSTDIPGIANDSESTTYKVLGFNVPVDCEIDGPKYGLQFDISFDDSYIHLHANRKRIVMVVAAAETEDEAIDRFRRAMDSPDELFVARRQEWEEYFERHVPKLSCDNPEILKMYYFIAYMMRSNIYDFGNGLLKHRFESTSKFRLLPQWFWDSAFGAMNEKWLNGLDYPKSSMSNTLEAQRDDGLLPFSLCGDQYTYGDWDIIQPFILPMAIWDYYLKSGDRGFIEKALPVLIGFDEWMMRNRDQNSEGLVDLRVPGESGWDNSKRYVLHEHLVQEESPLITEHRYIQSPDFNTYIYLGRKIIAEIASETGRDDISAEFNGKAETTASGIRQMWNEDTGLFMDRFADGHEQTEVKTPGGVIPLLSGLPTSEQAGKMVRNLTDPDIFWTPYPVTTLDLNDPQYNDDDEYFSYWNGRVWPQINWLIIEGLCRSGHYDAARELARLSIKMCSATGEPWCMENHHPQTGYPYFTHNAFNYVWGGLFNDMLLRRVAGIQPNAPSDEVYVNPLLNEDIGFLSVENIMVGDHTINATLTRTGETIRLDFSHSGDDPITLITSVGRTRICNSSVSLEGVTTFDTPHWLEF